METLSKSIEINAPKEKVWNVLTQDMQSWATAFAENVGGDWQQGGKVWFLGKDGTGMKGTITERRENEYIKFVNDVMVINNIETTDLKEWTGTGDTYMLTEKDGVTTLAIESIGTSKEDMTTMEPMWDEALKRIKDNSEH